MSSPYLDPSEDGTSGQKERLQSTDQLLREEHETSRHEAFRPRLSRRFSIGGLFHRTHHAKDQSIPAPKLSRRASTTSNGSRGTDHASSRSDSVSGSPLRRTKSLVGKLFRRKSHRGERDDFASNLDRQSSQRVSSMYLTEQQSTVRLPGLPEEAGEGESLRASEKLTQMSDSPQMERSASLWASVAPGESPIEQLFRPNSLRVSTMTSQPSPTAVRVITSSRCVLAHGQRLIQGTMMLSSQSVTFNCSVLHPRFTLNIPHGHIVAIVPFGDRTGIKVATQRRCLLFQGFPERDEFLQLFMEQWMTHCRTMLLADVTGATGIHDTTMACAWFRQSTGARNKLPPVQLKRAKSIGNRPIGEGTMSGGAGPVLPVSGGVNSCGCMEHYKHDVVRMCLQSTPLAIAGVLFGISGSGVSYAGTFFRARGGNTVEETPWTWDGDIRRRTVITNVPDAFRPTTLMRAEVSQRLTHESADIIVVDASLNLKRTSFGNNYKCHLRWCIVRERYSTEQSEGAPQDDKHVVTLPADVSNVRVTAEVTCTGHAPLPLQVVEERLVEFMRTNFTAMLETLRVRFQVASQEAALCEYPGQAKTTERISQFVRLALFLTVYRAREYLTDWLSGDRVLASDDDNGRGRNWASLPFYYWASGVLLLFIVAWTLISHYYSRTAPPLTTYNMTEYIREINLPSHITDEPLLKNITNILDFLEEHFPAL